MRDHEPESRNARADVAPPRPDFATPDLSEVAWLLDRTVDAIYVRDARTAVIRSWNRGAQAVYGWTAAEAVGQVAHTLLRTRFPRPLDTITATLETTGAWQGELVHVTRDGSEVAVESHWTVGRDAQGQPTAVLVIDCDVTMCRRAEMRLEGVLAAAPDAIVTVDREGRMVLVNAQAERLFGYAPGELLGQAVEVLVPEASRAAHSRLRAGYAAAPRTRPMGIGLDLTGLRKDGGAFPVEIRLSPLQTDEGLLVTAIIRDVSERQAAEARQRLLAEIGAVLGTSLDEATTLQQVARLAIPLLADFAAVDLLDEAGQLRRVAMAHRQPEQEAMLHEMNRRFPLALQQETLVTHAIRSGAPDLRPEIGDDVFQTLGQDAEHLRLWRALGLRSLLVVPLVARGKTLGGLVLAYGDSGRRYGPADQAFAEELALRAALAIDNARLYRQAQEAVRARDAFFSAASHDLRNPLAVIKMIAQTMAYQARRDTAVRPEQWEREALDVDRAVDRADGLVQQLLDVARLQGGRPLQLRRGRTDLVALVHQVAAEQQRLSPRHTVQVACSEERLEGEWDARRLERVVANLVGNAVKYSPAGGPVTVRMARDGEGWAVLEVADRGLGIPAQDVPLVFERFHRGANVLETIAGTGVGLASSRQIVEQHGGTIAVESEEGRGTRFTVRLPRADPADDVGDGSGDGPSDARGAG